MSKSSDRKRRRSFEELLSLARQYAEAGTYREALSAVREAKSRQPDNVYVLALEKQVEQLHELTDARLLTDDQRSDILESIPGIIERASQPTPPPSKPTAAAPQAATGTDRAAALEWLKNQYFQHAHEYVKKGEYENALAEIRRVYIIDPSNATAQDFEKQISELAEIRRTNVAAATSSRPPVPGTLGRAASATSGGAARAKPALPPEEPREKASPRRKVFTTVLLFIGLAIAAVAIVYAVRKLQPVKPAPMKPSDVGPSQEIFNESSSSPETTFVVPPNSKLLDSSAGRPPGGRKRQPSQQSGQPGM